MTRTVILRRCVATRTPRESKIYIREHLFSGVTCSPSWWDSQCTMAVVQREELAVCQLHVRIIDAIVEPHA